MFLLVNTGIAMLIVIAVVIAYAVCQNSLAGAQGVLVPRTVQRQHPLLRRLASPTSSPPSSPGSPRSSSPCSTRPGAGSAPPPCSASTALIGLFATLITKETFGPVERAAADAEDESMRVAA